MSFDSIKYLKITQSCSLPLIYGVSLIIIVPKLIWCNSYRIFTLTTNAIADSKSFYVRLEKIFFQFQWMRLNHLRESH